MADIIKKVNALGLLDQYTIAKSLGQEDEFCKSHNIDIEKGGKAATIGEIREFGGKKYQKQANGWRPVKKGDQKEKESDIAIHEDAAKIADHAGISKEEFNKLHPGTKKELYNNYTKDVKFELEKKGSEKKNYDEILSNRGFSKEQIDHMSEENKKFGVENKLKPHQYVAHFKSPQPTHIGDMSKEQKFAAAAKFGIENPEKLSTKELDKQLTDKNIEAELKKFKASKSKTFEQVLADPEGKQLIEGIEGLDLKREDHKLLYEDYKKQLKQKFGYDYK